MTKQEVQQRVLKNGKPLALGLFTWDEDTKTFSSKENGLVLDFRGLSNCTFDTSYDCTFNTGSGCTFKTGSRCTFNTGSNCTFKTGSRCVVVRRDIYEVIELDNVQMPIRLNGFNVKGFESIKQAHTITIDGKDIELSRESFENLKKQLV